MSTLTNGRVRKSLSDQLDRLDHTLDGLATGLQEAVETAVQEAVRRVLAEVLANAEFQAHLQSARQPTENCGEIRKRLQASQPAPCELGFRRLWKIHRPSQLVEECRAAGRERIDQHGPI